ncbi:hypothetical protein KAS24_03270 [Candidatus Bathyarchaeota archaeon]|nr:hypothetical protein [Candidatus Bathyarchaeota archaeon]
MPARKREEALKCEVDLMEKEIIYLTGRRRQKARTAYFRLLHSCGKACGIDEPIYLIRS